MYCSENNQENVRNFEQKSSGKCQECQEYSYCQSSGHPGLIEKELSINEKIPQGCKKLIVGCH